MKTKSIVAAVFANAVLVFGRTPGCNANNCMRQVSATRFGEAVFTSRFQDCEAFFRTTVVPPTVTDWVTATVTPTTVTETVETITYSVTTTVNTVVRTDFATVTLGSAPPPPNKRVVAGGQGESATITATAVPAYASSCHDAAAYSSACNCFQATHTTVTAPTPTVISTTTLSVTPTVQVTAYATLTFDVTATNVVTATTTVVPCWAALPAGGIEPEEGADCGHRGYLDHSVDPIIGYGDSHSTLESCAQQCAEFSGCMAIAFGDSGSNPFCEFQGAAHARYTNDQTQWRYYDMGCFKQCSVVY